MFHRPVARTLDWLFCVSELVHVSVPGCAQFVVISMWNAGVAHTQTRALVVLNIFYRTW